MTMPPDPQEPELFVQEAAAPQSLSPAIIGLLQPFLSRRRNWAPRAPLIIDGDDVLAIWASMADRVAAAPLLREAEGKAAIADALRRLVLAELAPLVDDAGQMAAFCLTANARRHNLKAEAPYREDIDPSMIADLVEILTLLPHTRAAIDGLSDRGIPTADGVFAAMNRLAPVLEAAGYQRSQADHLAHATANIVEGQALMGALLTSWGIWDGRRMAQALAAYTAQYFNNFGKVIRDLIPRSSRPNTPIILQTHLQDRAKFAMRQLQDMIEIDQGCNLIGLDGLNPKVSLSLDHLGTMIDGVPLSRWSERFVAMVCSRVVPSDDYHEIRLITHLLWQLEGIVIRLKQVPPVMVKWRGLFEQGLETAVRQAVSMSTDGNGNIVDTPYVWEHLARIEKQAKDFGSSILPLLPADDEGLRTLISLNMERWRQFDGLQRAIFLGFISATRIAISRAAHAPDPKMLAFMALTREYGL